MVNEVRCIYVMYFTAWAAMAVTGARPSRSPPLGAQPVETFTHGAGAVAAWRSSGRPSRRRSGRRHAPVAVRVVEEVVLLIPQARPAVQHPPRRRRSEPEALAV